MEVNEALKRLREKFDPKSEIRVDIAFLIREEFECLAGEIDRLRTVCAEAYQVCGAAGAPVRVLDNLSDAASGHSLRHETMLPVLMGEFTLERDALEQAAKACDGLQDQKDFPEGWGPVAEACADAIRKLSSEKEDHDRS